MPGPLLHFIIGSTGAGKTTYARRLCDETGAARFAIDEWMSALFWPDSPEPIDPDWAIERVARCSAMIWRTAVDVARRGTPCVLEIGLTMRADRARHAALAAAAGMPCRFHWLDVPADERWRRVSARNATTGADAQLAFPISREMFDFVEARWEEPDAGERIGYTIVRGGIL